MGSRKLHKAHKSGVQHHTSPSAACKTGRRFCAATCPSERRPRQRLRCLAFAVLVPCSRQWSETRVLAASRYVDCMPYERLIQPYRFQGFPGSVHWRPHRLARTGELGVRPMLSPATSIAFGGQQYPGSTPVATSAPRSLHARYRMHADLTTRHDVSGNKSSSPTASLIAAIIGAHGFRPQYSNYISPPGAALMSSSQSTQVRKPRSRLSQRYQSIAQHGAQGAQVLPATWRRQPP